MPGLTHEANACRVKHNDDLQGYMRRAPVQKATDRRAWSAGHRHIGCKCRRLVRCSDLHTSDHICTTCHITSARYSCGAVAVPQGVWRCLHVFERLWCPLQTVVFLTYYPFRLASSARHSLSNSTASRSKKSAAGVFLARACTISRTWSATPPVPSKIPMIFPSS